MCHQLLKKSHIIIYQVIEVILIIFIIRSNYFVGKFVIFYKIK